MSAFKVHRVAKVKAPPVLSGSSNSEDKVNDKKGQFKPKGGFSKPPLPGGKPRVVNSSFDSHEATPVRADHNQNKRNPQSAYCYASVEFRPLHVTDDGGISTAILPPRSRDSSKAVVKPKKEVTPYEEVDIPAGNFDKVNPESFLAEPNQTNLNTLNNSAVAAFTSDMQDMTQACLLMDDKRDLQQSALTHSSGKKPPPLPKPYSKSKEGVDMPDAGKRRTPPPMPKPYSSRNGKERSEEPSQPRGDLEVDAVYAVVQKPSKPKHVVEQKEEKTEEEENIDETPPPLPSRPDFETEEDLRKSQENVVGVDPQEVAEKSNKELSSDNDKPAKPVNAYLVTDIINQPSTKMFGQPEMYEPVSDVRDEEETYSNGSDLPEGWQEVNDAGDTYYWHVASGTTQWEKPQKAENVSSSVKHQANHDQQKPKPKTELKTVTSFPVHSMGWLELEESQVAPHNMSDTIAECISNLARQRKDLWKTSETWGEGKDLRLLLESDNLKLVDVQSKATLLVQPISKMRVWGAGRDELKDFAYVARDQATGKHKCHVFRCHGNISGRAIHNKLHEMCNKILAEKKKARGNQQQSSSTKQWSDILNTPPKPSLKDQAGFNVKPVAKVKKSFSAKYIGKVEVPRPSGIDVVHKAIDTATNARDPSKWRTCLIDITVSSVRSTDCMSQQVIAEDRIKFVSFIGVAKDVRLCGYISTSGQGSPFMCYVFQCTPNAASFTKALEEACRLRLQSCLDTNPELSPKLITAEPEKAPEKELKPAAGIKGFLGKLANQTKLGQKRSSEPTSGNKSHSQEPIRSFESPSPSSKYLIKYYGRQPVSVGTGATAIKEAVKAAQGTTLQISNVNIGPEGITLDDSINSGISRRLIHSGRISYCGLASDRIHFGVIEGQGGGKFICHVFAEYKTPVNTIVEAINRVL